jgi:hypothetical protein
MTARTGPLPTFAPLSEFASPTIEVQHTPPDDHPLDEVTPAHDLRLLTAYERIGYLTAQLEHWQARAAELEQQLADCETACAFLDAPPRRRWFPFGR